MLDFMTVMVLAATLLTVVALVAGVSAMASDGEVAHHTSGEWMIARVSLQGIALLLVLLLWFTQQT